MDIRERLKKEMEIIEKLGLRREEELTPWLGAGIEREILSRELRELELDILADPGALESQLVRVKRRKEN